MITKIDIKDALRAFATLQDVASVYGENEGGSQGKVSVADLMAKGNVFSKRILIPAGGQFELPYGNGMIMIQNTSASREKALAILTSGGSGNILVEEPSINFFSEVENKICIYSTGNYTTYIVKNTFPYERGVSFMMLT